MEMNPNDEVPMITPIVSIETDDKQFAAEKNNNCSCQSPCPLSLQRKVFKVFNSVSYAFSQFE